MVRLPRLMQLSVCSIPSIQNDLLHGSQRAPLSLGGLLSSGPVQMCRASKYIYDVVRMSSLLEKGQQVCLFAVVN
jgi:hypothetical protein